MEPAEKESEKPEHDQRHFRFLGVHNVGCNEAVWPLAQEEQKLVAGLLELETTPTLVTCHDEIHSPCDELVSDLSTLARAESKFANLLNDTTSDEANDMPADAVEIPCGQNMQGVEPIHGVCMDLSSDAANNGVSSDVCAADRSSAFDRATIGPHAWILQSYFVLSAAIFAAIGFTYANHPVSCVAYAMCTAAVVCSAFTIVHCSLRPRWYQALRPASVSPSRLSCMRISMHFCFIVCAILLAFQQIMDRAYDSRKLLPYSTIRMITRLERVFSLNMAITHLAKMQELAMVDGSGETVCRLQSCLVRYGSSKPPAPLGLPAIFDYHSLQPFSLQRLEPVFATSGPTNRERGLKNLIILNAQRYAMNPGEGGAMALWTSLSQLAAFYDYTHNAEKASTIYATIFASDSPVNLSSGYLYINEERMKQICRSSTREIDTNQLPIVGRRNHGQTVVLDLRTQIFDYRTGSRRGGLALSWYKACTITSIEGKKLATSEWPVKIDKGAAEKIANTYFSLNPYLPAIIDAGHGQFRVGRAMTFEQRMNRTKVSQGTTGDVLAAGDLFPPQVLLVDKTNSAYEEFEVRLDQFMQIVEDLRDLLDDRSIDGLLSDSISAEKRHQRQGAKI